jgi:hypothetical protein
MTRSTTRRIIALGVLALLGTAGPARAQSDADLRRENQRLTTHVDDLRRELEAARNLIEQLRAEVEMVRGLLASQQASDPAASTPPEEEPVSIDESKPHASPRALLRNLQKRYEEAIAQRDPGDPATLPGQRARASFLRDLNRWARRMNRELKSPIEWHVRLTGTSPRAGGSHLQVQAVDPKTGTILGDPFRVDLPQATVRRLREIEQRAQIDELVLRGVVIPQVMVNHERESQGQFDNPRFVGPFVEFSMSVEASSLTPVLPPRDPPERRENNRS